MAVELTQALMAQVWAIIKAATGTIIDAGLQGYLEEKIGAILPSHLKYYFEFDGAGQCRHIFHDVNTGESTVLDAQVPEVA